MTNRVPEEKIRGYVETKNGRRKPKTLHFSWTVRYAHGRVTLSFFRNSEVCSTLDEYSFSIEEINELIQAIAQLTYELQDRDLR